MKYVQPTGEVDPSASYKDRQTGAGVAGSRVPAAAIEHGMREIVNVITTAGLTPSGDDLTQLYQAIAQMISSATGGGETSTYVLMTAARSRLPIFPDVGSSDGTFNLSTPAAGTVRIPAGIDFIHRGIFSVTTVQQDFATSANRTYHLRWNPSTGWALKDVADSGYNPGALAEGDISFDTTYDDMLTHRVVTSAGNIATVTNLANKAALRREFAKTTYETTAVVSNERGPNTAPVQTVNWSRRPVVNWQEFKVGPATGAVMDAIVNMFFEATRYTCRPQVVGFYKMDNGSQGTIDGAYRVSVEA